MTTQETLAEFITGTSAQDIEPLAMEKARAAIIDCVGVALAGSRTPVASSMGNYFRAGGDFRADLDALLVGSALRASPSNAALYNGTIAHALDFDDGNHPGGAHLSAALVPALMSVSRDEDLFSDEFRCAYVIGYEVAAKIGLALHPRGSGQSWHPTGVLGPVGCAAAVAKLLSFDEATTINALGLSASTSAGVRSNVGSMAKPFHAGRSAQAGVMAALLAREGFDAAPNAFDAPTGFFQGFSRVTPDELAQDVHEALGTIGNPWEICTDVGIWLKPYPSCGSTHPGIEAALQVGAKIDPSAIENIYVGMSAAATESLIYHLPTKELEGKFSMEYCVAAALLWGSVTMETFTDDKVQDSDIRALIHKTTTAIDDRVRDSLESAAIVRVTLISGEVVEESVQIAKGKGDRWMSIDDQSSKFESTAGSVLGIADAAELFAMMSADQQSERKDIARLLSQEVR